MLAFAGGSKDVGVEDGAVAHGDGDAVLDRNVVAGRDFFGELPLGFVMVGGEWRGDSEEKKDGEGESDLHGSLVLLSGD